MLAAAKPREGIDARVAEKIVEGITARVSVPLDQMKP